MTRLREENASLKRLVKDSSVYQCRISDAKTLADSGVLSDATDSVNQQALGATFTVDCKTGVAAGSIGNNWTFESHEGTFAPPDNPFYVVSKSHGPNRNLTFLMVRDWLEGDLKPFVLVDSEFVFSGTCI